MATSAANKAKKGAVQEVTDALRRRILRGELAPGAALPGERDLAEELGVSRLTLRSAIAHLESEGLLRPVHGSGTRVLDYRESGGVDLLGPLAHTALAERDIPGGLEVLASLLELRRAVAVEVIGLAADRATVEEMRAMRAHVALLATQILDARAFMHADLAFARMLVRATNNIAFELLFNTVVRTVEQHPGFEIAFYANAPATLAVYGRLLDRIEARDASRARATASRLLARLDRTTIDALTAMAPRARTKRG